MKEPARDRLARFLKKQGISNQNLIESLIGRIDCLFQENVEGKIKTKENKNVIKQWEEFEFLLLKNPAIKEILVVNFVHPFSPVVLISHLTELPS